MGQLFCDCQELLLDRLLYSLEFVRPGSEVSVVDCLLHLICARFVFDSIPIEVFGGTLLHC